MRGIRSIAGVACLGLGLLGASVGLGSPLALADEGFTATIKLNKTSFEAPVLEEALKIELNKEASAQTRFNVKVVNKKDNTVIEQNPVFISKGNKVFYSSAGIRAIANPGDYKLVAESKAYKIRTEKDFVVTGKPAPQDPKKSSNKPSNIGATLKFINGAGVGGYYSKTPELYMTEGRFDFRLSKNATEDTVFNVEVYKQGQTVAIAQNSFEVSRGDSSEISHLYAIPESGTYIIRVSNDDNSIVATGSFKIVTSSFADTGEYTRPADPDPKNADKGNPYRTVVFSNEDFEDVYTVEQIEYKNFWLTVSKSFPETKTFMVKAYKDGKKDTVIDLDNQEFSSGNNVTYWTTFKLNKYIKEPGCYVLKAYNSDETVVGTQLLRVMDAEGVVPCKLETPAGAKPVGGATKPTDGTAKPGTGATKPGTVKPGASKPGTVKPGASKPGTVKPGASKPGATKPGVASAKPIVIKPGASASAPKVVAGKEALAQTGSASLMILGVAVLSILGGATIATRRYLVK